MNSSEDFISRLGRPMVAHRLRRLSELLLDGYARWLPEAGVTAPARSLSTLLLLAEEGPLGVTELAARLRLSHPLMIKLVAALQDAGFVTTNADPGDGRRRPARLTERGRTEARRVGTALAALDRAFADLFQETGVDLFDAVARVELACRRETFTERLQRAAVASPEHEEVQCD
ncbi:MAG TPA: MarR family transcriptional regulator [Allosphingosinicella sp.]|jgi:DNA-binding MarR family transcriptional regulator